nr:hypothetical protein [Nonomuraea pusilla]
MRVNKIAWSAAMLAVTVGFTTSAAPAAAAPAITVKSDFTADGYNDIAVGMRLYPSYAGADNSDMIAVLYGGPNGLSGAKQSTAIGTVNGDDIMEAMVALAPPTARPAMSFGPSTVCATRPHPHAHGQQGALRQPRRNQARLHQERLPARPRRRQRRRPRRDRHRPAQSDRRGQGGRWDRGADPRTASGPDVSAARILTQDGIASPRTASSVAPIAEESVADDRMGDLCPVLCAVRARDPTGVSAADARFGAIMLR